MSDSEKNSTQPNHILTTADYEMMIHHLQYGVDTCRIFEDPKIVEAYIAKLKAGVTLEALNKPMILASLQNMLSRVYLYYELYKNYYRELLIIPEQMEEAGYSETEVIGMYDEVVKNMLALRRIIKKIRA